MPNRTVKSIQGFSKKEQWFKENWMSLSKPKHAINRGPSKQEKYTIPNIISE